jgi:hypothetical protein
VDCSGEDDQCNDGVCNDATGACEAIPVADSTSCEDGNVCTSETGAAQTPDHCEAGDCVGVPVDCSGEDDQCNDGVCNAATGACEAIPNAEPCDDGNVCTIGDMCVDGVCVPGFGSCEGICRTAGFWGTHGGDGGQNVTLGAIELAGGSINVCGQTIDSTQPVGEIASALEALCVKVEGELQRQLYRQLVAATLNCAISGSSADCGALVEGYDECNQVCIDADTLTNGEIGACVGVIDCFNNGGELIDTGEGEECLIPESSCHDVPLCPADTDGDGVPDVEGLPCFEPLGPASSPKDCNLARKNDCTIDMTDLCEVCESDGEVAAPSELSVVMSKLNDGKPGNDRLTVRGSTRLVAGRTFAEFSPEVDGSGVMLTSADGQIQVYVAVPEGSYDKASRKGWKTNNAGSKWNYRNKSVSGGISKMSVRDNNRKNPGGVTFQVKGSKSDYPFAPGNEPLSATVIFGWESVKAAGQCGATAFFGSQCRFNGAGTKLRCR